MSGPDDWAWQLPHNRAAEQVTLGAMMTAAEQIGEVAAVLGPADFYVPAHQIVFEAIMALSDEGKPAGAVAVADRLTGSGQLAKVGGGPYLHTLLASVPAAASAGFYARIVRDRSTERQMIEAGGRIIRAGHAHGVDLAEKVDAAYRVLDAAAGVTAAAGAQPVGELLNAALEAIEAGPGRGVGSGWEDLDELTGGMRPGQMITIASRVAVGKALALGTPLPTPSGWTTMAAVRAGDYVLGQDGKPTRVLAATEVMHGRPCYEIEFSDGSVIVADAEHLWLTNTLSSRKSAAAKLKLRDSPFSGSQEHRRILPQVRTTAEIAATLRCSQAGRTLNHSVTNCQPVRLPSAELPVAPYTLGAWLGDGDSNGSGFTCNDAEILDEIRLDGYEICASRNPIHYRITSEPERQARITRARRHVAQGATLCRAARHEGLYPDQGVYRAIGLPSGGTWNAPLMGEPGTPYRRFTAALRDLGVLDNKHIPDVYLRASEEQRRDLLAGLLDTDGYCNKRGTVVLALTNKRLAYGARELVSSFGYASTMRTKQVRGRSPAMSVCYMVTFTPPDKVFRLPRKLARQRRPVRGLSLRRAITAVRPVPSQPVRCIQVSNTTGMYLAGEAMIPTHNSLILLNIAARAALGGVPVLVCSVEMSRQECIERILAAAAGVELTRLRDGTARDSDWERLKKARGPLADAPLMINDEGCLRVADVRADVRAMRRAGTPPGLVVIDYLQLMTGAGRAENRQAEVSGMSRGIKLLAKEFGVPVVVGAQLNRGPEMRSNHRPLLADLRDSGSIEQDSDVVVLLYRDEMYGGRVGEIELHVAKNRHGRTGVVTLGFQGHYGRARELGWSPSGQAAEPPDELAGRRDRRPPGPPF